MRYVQRSTDAGEVGHAYAPWERQARKVASTDRFPEAGELGSVDGRLVVGPLVGAELVHGENGVSRLVGVREQSGPSRKQLISQGGNSFVIARIPEKPLEKVGETRRRLRIRVRLRALSAADDCWATVAPTVSPALASTHTMTGSPVAVTARSTRS